MWAHTRDLTLAGNSIHKYLHTNRFVCLFVFLFRIFFFLFWKRKKYIHTNIFTASAGWMVGYWYLNIATAVWQLVRNNCFVLGSTGIQWLVAPTGGEKLEQQVTWVWLVHGYILICSHKDIGPSFILSSRYFSHTGLWDT